VVLFQSFLLFIAVLELHALHARELHLSGVFLVSDEAYASEVVPLPANFTLEHVRFPLVGFLAHAEYAAF
jgi:hypothetical protein